jgi:hypothetical protein
MIIKGYNATELDAEVGQLKTEAFSISLIIKKPFKSKIHELNAS